MPSLAILVSAVLVLFYRADTHTHTHTGRQNHRITEADQHYTHASTVGVSEKTGPVSLPHHCVNTVMLKAVNDIQLIYPALQPLLRQTLST